MRTLQLKKHELTGEGKIFDITDRLTIGRHSDNDIVIRLEKVSRHHCMIYVDETQQIFVKDLHSANGTFVNAQKIDRIQVYEHDILQIGPEKFEFINIDDSETAKGLPTAIEEFTSLLLHPLLQPKIANIQAQTLDVEAKQYQWPVNTICTIGRLQFSDLWVDDTGVSRRHAMIDIRENRVLISDTSSTNGTFVNEERITQSEIRDGDIIRIGKTFQFRVTFVVDSANTLSSVKQHEDIYTVDILKDDQKLLELFEKEYGEQVLLEVDRQVSLFSEECNQLLRTTTDPKARQKNFIKLLRLLSKSHHIIDNTTYQKYLEEGGEIEGLNTEKLQKIKALATEDPQQRILYFEQIDSNTSQKIVRINGLSFYVQEDFYILIFHIPLENLVYLLYLSECFSQF